MTVAAWIILAWCGAVASLRLGLVARLVQAFSRRAGSDALPGEWPPVTVVMALRGGDEFLALALRRLAALDYPDYRIRLVVDGPQDPAMEVVRRFLDSRPDVDVEVIHPARRLMRCSGKVAGLLVGTEDLPPDCEAVAVFDGDAVVHPTCLRELVAALRAGAMLAAGNRWYAPSRATAGGLSRFLWNCCAVPVMNALRIPWGGCMAMRASVAADPDLRERLSRAFGEDSTLATWVHECGGVVTFVPQATLVNREDVDLRSFYAFLVRQYLTVRLHNPAWWFVCGSTAALALAVFACHAWFCVAGLAAGPVLVGYCLVAVAVTIECATGCGLVRRRIAARDDAVPRLSLLQLALCPLVLTLLNYVNLVACLHAACARRHAWRGITYRIGGGSPVEIIEVVGAGGRTASDEPEPNANGVAVQSRLRSLASSRRISM